MTSMDKMPGATQKSWRVIPQYINVSTVPAVDVPFDHLRKYLADMAKSAEDVGGEFLMNPDFQRGNVWTVSQQKAFVEYVLMGGLQTSPIIFNAPWWKTSGDSDHLDMVCVDGLQRMTAVLRFIDDEITIFDRADFGPLQYSLMTGHLRMHACLRIATNDLKKREQVLEWYLQLNSGGTVHTAEELNKVKRLLEDERRNKS